ncbi:HNH endonuclease [Ralstonia thomasii]|uniref:HNH endonuclease n=1 Tax=Ralstonia thomasii TaxID=3058596 RepID=UPI00292D2762|nr:HNH endonuclease [Ralstonia sp. LMG 18095]
MGVPIINTTRYSRITGSAGVRQRKRIRERDNYHCKKCGVPVLKGEVDHKVPLEEGGSNDDSNLWLLCDECHKEKTARDRGYKIRSDIDDTGLPLNPNHHWNT